MTTVELNHYTQGDPEAPAVLLGHSLGATLAMWDHLAADLARDYHVVRFDLRGHGSSPVPPSPYSMSDLAADVVRLADDLELGRFGYVGLSIGGAVGLTLALEHADRVSSLVLCCTAPRFGDPADWHDRAALVAREGTAPLLEATEKRWFTEAFRAAEPGTVREVMGLVAATSREGYAGCCEANAGYDVTGRLGEVATPTRVVVGSEDPTAGPEVGRALADGIPGADLVVVEGVAHLANIAAPGAFDRAVHEHLDRTLRA